MSEDAIEFEIIVVGAGPAGLAAASAAAESGARVGVVDDSPWLGGQIWRGQQAHPSSTQAQQWLRRFQRCNATILSGTAVIASPRPGVLLASHERGPRELRWQRLILTTGARELFLPFPGWTMPGVMGPGGLQNLVKNGWPIRGQHIIVAGSGPLLLAVADGLQKHGARIVSMNEQAPWSSILRFGLGLGIYPGKLWQGAQLKRRLLGVRYRCGVWPLRADGDERVQRVVLTDGQRAWSEDCDVFACGFGLVPNVELALALDCELDQGFVRVNEMQKTSVVNVYCAGEPTGIGGADCALIEGQIAGYAAGGKPRQAEALFEEKRKWHRFRSALAAHFTLRPELKALSSDETLVCRCEDVTLGQMRQFSGWREAKLQSRCGMGSCQGRVCGAAAKVILGWGMESVRPPIFPTPVANLISPGHPSAEASQ